jgi:hypothetical protein
VGKKENGSLQAQVNILLQPPLGQATRWNQTPSWKKGEKAARIKTSRFKDSYVPEDLRINCTKIGGEQFVYIFLSLSFKSGTDHLTGVLILHLFFRCFDRQGVSALFLQHLVDRSTLLRTTCCIC